MSARKLLLRGARRVGPRRGAGTGCEGVCKPDKAATALAVPTTVTDYHIKAHDPKTRQTLYLRRYADGKVHAVITDRESRVTDFGEVQGGLTTQRSPTPIEAFDGFMVEDKRTPGATVPPLDTRRGTQTQKAASSLTPHTQTTPRLQESKRFVPGVPLNTLIKDTRAVAQSAARLLNQQLPGIVGPKLTFVTNPAELLASNYAAENSFTAEEVAQMQEAEAFFDNDTGYTIVFTDAIEVRPGESERAAVARVILHERVGHDGFNALHQHEAKFRESWDRLSAKIPSTELDALAHDYPHLSARKLLLRGARRVGPRRGAGTGCEGVCRQDPRRCSPPCRCRWPPPLRLPLKRPAHRLRRFHHRPSIPR